MSKEILENLDRAAEQFRRYGHMTTCDAFDRMDADAAEIERLRTERDALKADYLRRHQDACDYWMALKLIAEGYGPNHGSKYCHETAQNALDRPTAVPSDHRGTE